MNIVDDWIISKMVYLMDLMDWTWLNIGCTLITMGCTVWNVCDRWIEKSPFAAFSKGDIYVSNPRRKALVIRSISFKGEPVPKRTGDPPQNEPSIDVNFFVLGGETTRAPWAAYLQDSLLYEASLKRVSWFNWNVYHLIVLAREKPLLQPQLSETRQEPGAAQKTKTPE